MPFQAYFGYAGLSSYLHSCIVLFSIPRVRYIDKAQDMYTTYMALFQAYLVYQVRAAGFKPAHWQFRLTRSPIELRPERSRLTMTMLPKRLLVNTPLSSFSLVAAVLFLHRAKGQTCARCLETG